MPALEKIQKKNMGKKNKEKETEKHVNLKAKNAQANGNLY